MYAKILIILAILGCTTACSPGPDTWREFVYDSTEEIVVEVGYTEGAEPYFNPLYELANPWDILARNIEVLFPGRRYRTPKSLKDTHFLGKGQETFSKEEIRALADQLPGGARALHVVMVNGVSKEKATLNGYNLKEDRGVIALFKGAYVLYYLSPEGNIFQEQSALLHEFGHAVGLVNDGIPMVSAHNSPTDTVFNQVFNQPEIHDRNPACIMYPNGGSSKFVDWDAKKVRLDQIVLFDDACIADVQAAQMK